MAASLFQYRNGELYCEDVPLRRIALSAGTPAYVYSVNGVLANFRQFQQAFDSKDALVCYALKANANLELVGRLAAEGCGADIVSGGELVLALKAGVPAGRVVFAGVGKRNWEIRLALEAGILALNVESLEELKTIAAIAERAAVRAPVSLRLNPDVDIHGHPYLTTGRRVDKFGIGLDQIEEAVRFIDRTRALELVGLHCHLGSQIQEPEPYFTAAEIVAGVARRIGGRRLQHVDIGGGIGVKYEVALAEEGDCFAFDPAELAQGVRARLQDVAEKILLEPGRAIVANAGALICRVLYTKTVGGRSFVVVDGAMNDFLRPALYGARHRVLPVDARSGDSEPVDVVGPVCESGDFFAREVELPRLRRGDLLGVLGVGAYGYVLASNYNARPRPPEVLVEGDRFWISRPRESGLWGIDLPADIGGASDE